MHYCPHCHRPTAYDKGPCPHCGKELSGADEKTAPSESLPVTIGEVSLEESGGSLELDLEPVHGRAAGAAAEGEGGMRARAPAPEAVGVEDLKREKKKPKLELETEEELERISGYGRAPDGWVGAVSYMIRVLKRRKLLDQELGKVRQEAAARKKDLDDDLLIIGRRKLAEEGVEKNYSVEKGAVDLARERVEEMKEEKSVEAREMEDKEAFLDEELMKLQGEIDKYRVEEEALGREAGQRNADYKRMRLRVQRLDIEARNTRQLMVELEKEGASSTAAKTASMRSQLDDIEKQKKSLQPELEILRAAAEEVDRKLAMVRSTVAELMGKMTLSEKRKAAMVSTLKKRSEEKEEKFKTVREEYHDAVRRLALESYRRDDLPEEMADMKEKLAWKIKVADETGLKLENYRKARDSYSRAAFQRAYITLGGGAALAVILVILLAVLL